MKLTFRVWILLICIALSLISIFSIPPTFMEKGVLVKSLDKNSTLFEEGLRMGDIIISINGQAIGNSEDYALFMDLFSDNQTHKITIITKTAEIILLASADTPSKINIENIPKTRIKTGLDLQGGARALIAPEEQITEEQLDDLISIAQNRLNVYGLSDVSIKKVSDLSGNRFMLVEVAGSSPQDLEELVARQGKFEAKIGNDTVFVGGDKDVTYVGRSGQDAGIYQCNSYSGEEICQFRFTISLSEKAAQRQADITANMSLNSSSGGKYLEKPLELYVDGILTDSLNIGVDLKGKVATQIQISGSGVGKTRQEAIDDASVNMKKLQTILITGSVPFKLKIVKIDKISPLLGDNFTKSILMGGVFAILAVSAIIFLRYKNIKISLALLLTSFSEIVIILGVASLIKWNLDLVSIAGIIATIGTGVDSQIVILDESRVKGESIKEKIKKALFIIFSAYATAFVSLVPLTGWLSFMGIAAVSAGLLKGFAITSLIGITAGVFITRPAFADIIKKIEGD